jgi:hypothetical protein
MSAAHPLLTIEAESQPGAHVIRIAGELDLGGVLTSNRRCKGPSGPKPIGSSWTWRRSRSSTRSDWERSLGPVVGRRATGTVWR